MIENTIRELLQPVANAAIDPLLKALLPPYQRPPYIYLESIVLRIPEGHTIERLEQRITELKRGVERRASRTPNMKIPEFQVNC